MSQRNNPGLFNRTVIFRFVSALWRRKSQHLQTPWRKTNLVPPIPRDGNLCAARSCVRGRNGPRPWRGTEVGRSGRRISVYDGPRGDSPTRIARLTTSGEAEYATDSKIHAEMTGYHASGGPGSEQLAAGKWEHCNAFTWTLEPVAQIGARCGGGSCWLGLPRVWFYGRAADSEKPVPGEYGLYPIAR